MKKYNILSIDGGGMKGISSAIVLMELEKKIAEYSNRPDARLSDYFELIAGTSTGAIIAGLLLCPDADGKSKYKASDAYSLYKKYGAEIFKPSLLRKAGTYVGISKSKYSNIRLKQLLKLYYGDVTLADLLQNGFIPSYELEKGSVVFYDTKSAKTGNRRNYFLRDVVLASAAAPTYFPPVELKSLANEQYGMIDGGVVCNNPAMCAVVEALKNPEILLTDQLRVFSVGNIVKQHEYAYEKAKQWNLVQWVEPLIHIYMGANEQMVDYQLRMLYHSFHNEEYYVRVVKEVSEETKIPKMDDASEEAIRKFEQIGYEMVQENQSQIDRFAQKIVLTA